MKLDQATADRLRELGASERMISWLEHPAAVERLLELDPYVGDDHECEECQSWSGSVHGRTCSIAAAWYALGDSRSDREIDTAWLLAVREARQRYAPSRGLPRTMTEMSERLNTYNPDVIDASGYAYNALLRLQTSPYVREGTAYVMPATPLGRLSQVQMLRDGGLIDHEYAMRLLLGEQPTVDHAAPVDDRHGLDVDDAAGGLKVADTEPVDPV
jgi:hypothetical protein